MDIYKRAKELQDELVAIRRHIHENPEVGFELPKTVAFVKEKLIEYGYSPRDIGNHGVTTTIGSGGKVFMIRGDMDALLMPEETGLCFASKTNGVAHMCGHDMHTTMVLGAAKLLKEMEGKLKGTVKFLFQPAEELLTGARNMIEAGIMENPKVDAAIMCHVDTMAEPGVYIKTGEMATANNNFRITVTGKGAHGAMPEMGIDTTLVGAHIVIGLQTLVSREISFKKSAALTTGHFEAGKAPNIIPETALIEGTMRTFSPEVQTYIKKRLPELVESIAKTYRATAKVEYLSDVSVTINNEEFTNEIRGYIEELAEGNFDVHEASAVTASEDFSFYASRVPALMMMLGVKDPSGHGPYPLHNPKTVFDEGQMHIGSACFAAAAIRWLENHQ